MNVYKVESDDYQITKYIVCKDIETAIKRFHIYIKDVSPNGQPSVITNAALIVEDVIIQDIDL